MRGGYKSIFFLVPLAVIVGFYSVVGLAVPVFADSLNVTATVPAPLPTAPPVITSPPDQSHFTTDSITVQGTCSSDTAYIAIDRNNLFAGTAACLNGQFTLQISLFSGPNTLIARSFSSTDGEGPSSTPITIYRDIPPEPIPPSAPLPSLPPVSQQLPLDLPVSPPSQEGAGEGIYLSYDPRYLMKRPGEVWSWLFTIHGGTPPYIFTVDWGDETNGNYVPDVNNHVIIEHTYRQEGTFAPIARVIDSRGQAATMQFFAVAKSDAAPLLYSPPYYSWIAVILLTSLLSLFALLDIELLVASVIQFLRGGRTK